jgi:AbrB family looped-hinge helix DNA binding protein
MSTEVANTPMQVGPQGRIVIPVAVRQTLGIEPGDTLVARVEDGRLVLETRARLLARFSARFAGARVQPAGGGAGSVVDELIAERRVSGREGGVSP